MKKCASCAKDLPEAALHCVFCGAKQPPDPAMQGGVAKTAFGYSANEVLQAINRPRPVASQPPPRQPSQPQPNAANAPTTFTPRPPGPQPGHGQPSAGMGIHSPQQFTPMALPTAAPPYLASQTAARAGHPIEPWKLSLRIVMFIWGALTLAAFVTPVSSEPIAFQWDSIIHGSGTDIVLPLLFGAVGLLAIVLAAIPIEVRPRGILAALLGLAGIFVPVLLHGMPPWQALVGLVATVVLITGLLVRNEYVESTFARILVTLGVVCVLVPLLIPEHGEVPLVMMFKALIDAPGTAKIVPALELGVIVITVMALLAWMPGPATGGAKVFAWLLILWPTLIAQAAVLLVQGHVGDVVKDSPFRATMSWAPAAAYLVLVGYGLATVLGKQLE